jgi:hypothetical protein
LIIEREESAIFASVADTILGEFAVGIGFAVYASVQQAIDSDGLV